MVEGSGILAQWLDGWQASACHLQCLSKMLSSLITVCVKLLSFKSTASVADMLLEFTCRATGKWKVTVGISSAKNAKLLIWMKCSTSQISWWVLTLWTLNISVHLLCTVVYIFPFILKRTICSTIKASQVGNHFFYTCNFNVWFKSDIVRRN